MKHIQPISTFEQIKLLADARRMHILRLLMAEPATLTQLARTLGQSPAWVRHHVQILESANLIELAEVRTTNTVTEKYYRARAGAFLLQELVLPKGDKPVILFAGSHDLAIETVADQLSQHVTMLSLPVGSLDGLLTLRQGLCQISGAHLLDVNGEYNIPYVRHIFPDREMELITLAHRTQGLMLAPGNPLGLRGLADLARPGVRFVNRNPGSGTRLWLDGEFKRLNIPVEKVSGYQNAVATHSETARTVAEGRADAAIGLQAAADRFNLDFIPLFDERYDLVLTRENEETLKTLLDYIQTAGFRKMTGALSGYNTAHSGEQINVT